MTLQAALLPVDRLLRTRWVKPVIFALCLLPLAVILFDLANGRMGANPNEALNRALGDWALRFLLLTLAVTPLRVWAGLAGAMRFRRMLGLYAFFYAALHVVSYTVIDQGLDGAALWADLVKRRYITIGMVALILLLPLAVTSTKGWIRRLGGARWTALHRLVYPAAVLVVVHFFMMIKADYSRPAAHAAVLAVLLAARLVKRP